MGTHLALLAIVASLGAPAAWRLETNLSAPPPEGMAARCVLADGTPPGTVTLYYTDADGAARAVPTDRYDAGGQDVLAWRWDDVPEAGREALGLLIAPGDGAGPAGAVQADYSPFLVRVKSDNTDAWVLKKYPSYPTVLHDAGFRVDGRLEHVYGWWCAGDVPLAGQVRHLSEPDFVSLHPEGPDQAHDGPLAQCVTLSAASVDVPEARITTTCEFLDGFSGVRVSRLFHTTAPGTAPWGGSGNWLGGLSTWFPTHATKTPSAAWVDGAWREKGPVPGESGPASFLLYWDDDAFWMAGVPDPAALSGPFRDPRVVFTGGGVMMPAWQETTASFDTGGLGAYYLVGRGTRAEAVAWLEAVERYLADPPRFHLVPGTAPKTVLPWAPPEEVPAPPAPPAAWATITLENEALRLDFDPSSVRVTSLCADGVDWLDGRARAIYFTGGSDWPRALDWEDTDDRYLAPDIAAAEHVVEGEEAFRFGPVDLCDPETGEAVFTVHLRIALEGDEAQLSATFTARRDVRSDYLGWHGDFPADRFRWYRQGVWDHDAGRWENYRMGFHDHQPMRYNLGADPVTAYGEDAAAPAFAFRFLDDTDTDLRAVNLPNPLFDTPRGVQKTALTATERYWRRHNTVGQAFAAGETHTIAVGLRPGVARPGPADAGLVRVDLPRDPERSAVLDAFWRDKCSGGPRGHAGVNAWWHALTGRFSPPMTYATWRANLESILAEQSDGTVDNGAGWAVPAGGLPHSPGHFGWNGGYLFEVNAHVVLSAEQYYLVSGDRAFLEQWRAALERSVAFYRDLTDVEGLVTLPEKYNGYGQYCTSFYWDAWHIGHQAAHGQMYAAAAAAALARIEQALGRDDEAERLEAEAARLREALVRHYWRGEGITDNAGQSLPGGRLLSWVNVKGEVIDAGFTDLSLMAIASGGLPGELGRAALTWLDHDPHAYAWKDRRTGQPAGIVTFNTIDGNSTRVYVGEPGPRRYYAGGFNPFSDPPGMENGQTMVWVAGFDLYARALLGRGGSAGEKLFQFLDRYAAGDMNQGHGVPESRPLPMFQGTSQMAPCDLPVGSDQSLGESGLLYGLGLVSGILGLRCDYAGLYVEPDVPEAFGDAELTGLRYGRHDLTVRFHGHGDRVTRLVVDGVAQPGTRYALAWEEDALRQPRKATVVEVHLGAR